MDAALAERVRALEARKEALTERVADLRRDGGARAAERWRAAWEAESGARDDDGDERVDEHDDKGEDKNKNKNKDEDEEAPLPERGGGVDMGELRRWERVRATHGRALDGMVGLKTGLAGTAGRLAEAVEVAEQLGSAGRE
jgi:hypothetical protein